jgi:hypothetical protein
MKTNLLKIFTAFLFMSLLGTGCEKDEIQYADEGIEVSSSPNISVYRTKSDYFNLISLQLLPTGQLNAIPSYTKDDSRIKVDANGKISPNTRWRLKSGYIVDKESYINRVYTNITFQEYVDYNTKNKVAGWPDDLIEPRIIDKDPFIEYYILDGLNKEVKTYTLRDINEMIENGTLETVFTKLK